MGVLFAPIHCSGVSTETIMASKWVDRRKETLRVQQMSRNFRLNVNPRFSNLDFAVRSAIYTKSPMMLQYPYYGQAAQEHKHHPIRR